MEIMLQYPISWVQQLPKLHPMPHNLFGLKIGNDEISYVIVIVEIVLIFY